MAEHAPVPAIGAAPEDVPTEHVMELLQDPERRHLLSVLGQLETPERLSALTRCVAMTTDVETEEELHRVSLRLYHTHLPKFAAAGLVQYDESDDAVALTERGRALADVVEDVFDV